MAFFNVLITVFFLSVSNDRSYKQLTMGIIKDVTMPIVKTL